MGARYRRRAGSPLMERVWSALPDARDAEIERLQKKLRHYKNKWGEPATINALLADIELLREAVMRLLACPAIADEDHSDPEWGCAETREAEAFARSALAPEKTK